MIQGSRFVTFPPDLEVCMPSFVRGLMLGVPFLLACGGGDGGDDGTGPTQVATSVSISPATVDTLFAQNATVDLDATVRDQNNAVMAAATVTWSTSNANVALVNATSGVVTARAVGNAAQLATITATVNGATGVTASVPVRVRQKVTTLSMPDAQTVAVGATVALAAALRDANANVVTGLGGVTYGSANTGIATVNAATGVVSGVAAGTAKIGATIAAEGTTFTDTTVVTVTGGGGPPLTATVTTPGLNFNPANVTIARTGEVTWQLAASHNVTFAATAGAPANIGTCATGTCTTARTFNTAGTFDYQCTNHAGMNGTVTVQP